MPPPSSHHASASATAAPSHAAGISPQLFGPSVWCLIFIVAHHVDRYLAKNPTRRTVVDAKARQQIYEWLQMLPCRMCRDDSTQFLCHPYGQWMHDVPTLGERVFWLRVQVNDKLARQELEAARTDVERATIRARWSRYTARPENVVPAPVRSASMARCLLSFSWFAYQNDVVRDRIPLAHQSLVHLLRETDEPVMADLVESLGGSTWSSSNLGRNAAAFRRSMETWAHRVAGALSVQDPTTLCTWQTPDDPDQRESWTVN